MKAKGLLFILSTLICWFGISASNKNEVTPLFDGNKLVTLNEVQGKLLDSVITLLIENDSIVIIPHELNYMMGDTTQVSYIAYPDWSTAYFKKKGKKDYYLYVPTYAETPQGIISSEIFVEFEKEDRINCFVETILPIDNEMEMNTMYIASSIQGEFLRSKAYKKRDIRAHKLGILSTAVGKEQEENAHCIWLCRKPCLRKKSADSSSPHGGRLLLIWHISSTMYLLKELIEPFNSSLLDHKTT